MDSFTAQFMKPGQGIALGTQQYMADPSRGGQYGYMPNYEEYLQAHPYVGANIIAVMLRPPAAFSLLPNGDKWIATCRALFETQRQRITGLNMGLKVETTTVPFGGAGQVFHEPTDVKEDQTNLVMSLPEKAGQPWFWFFAEWIRLLIMDPASKVPAINTLPGINIEELTAADRGATVAFFEPDRLHKRVLKAWIGTNIYPLETGENIGQYDVNSPQDKRDLDIPFAGLYQTGRGPIMTCQRLLDAMTLTGANPNMQRSFIEEVSPDTLAAQGSNYTGDLEYNRQHAVQV